MKWAVLIAVAGVLGSIALGLDWLLGGVGMNAAIFDSMAPEAIIQEDYGVKFNNLGFGLRDDAPWCVPKPKRTYGDNIDQFFDCALVKVSPGNDLPLPGGSAPSCNPVGSEVYIHRDLPFTEPRLDALLYLSGSGTGARAVKQLSEAHAMSPEVLAIRHPEVMGRHRGFFSDPEPDMSFLDCPGYSIVRLSIQRP